MGSLTYLADPGVPIVADASVIINLIASGCAADIIRALPNRLTVVDIVPAELETGRRQGRLDADRLKALVSAGLVDIVKLTDEAEQYFEGLVIGVAAETLDDGEAATIAYSVACGAIALVDERKAKRICSERFPKQKLGCSIDIFTHSDVEKRLGREVLAQAVFNALVQGRMRILPHHIEWVVGLIGTARTALCKSLPNSVRVSTNLSVEK
jgi:predicted nucleic acid-binding protein